MFELTKWYLDLVTDQGTAVVAYMATCRLGTMAFSYASVLVAPPGMPAVEDSTGGRVDPPQRVGERLRWQSEALGFQGEWSPLGPAIQQTLLDGPEGGIHWTCHLPRSRAHARLGERDLEGLGYVERLRLTLPPWRLPFRSLRWGRHLSLEHSLVWIDWARGTDRRWVWLDARPEPAAELTPAGVWGLSDGQSLRLHPPAVLRDRRVLERLGRALPEWLRARLGPLAGMREQKWLARSEIENDGTPCDAGWAIYEEVTW